MRNHKLLTTVFLGFPFCAVLTAIWTMSDGLARLLEGRNVLTHNGTIQAI